MTLSRKSGLLLLIAGLFLAALVVHADEPTAGDPPPISTPLPTEEAVQPTEVVTDIPALITAEPPIETPATDVPPSQAAPTEEVPIVTLEPTTSSETQEPESVIITLPQTYTANFEANYPVELSAAANWTVVDIIGGSALQSTANAETVTYTRAAFIDGAVEARFRINSGEGSVLLGGYKAALNSIGLLTLSRGSDALATYQASLTGSDDEWSKVRLQVISGQILVSFNDSIAIDYTDAAVTVEGFAGFAASAEAVLRVDDFAVYGTPVTVFAPAPVIPVETVTPEAMTPTEGEMPLNALPMANEPITLVGSTNNSTHIVFTWNDVSDDVGYRLEYSTDGGITWASDNTRTSQDVTTYNQTTVSCGDVELKRVRAILTESPLTLSEPSSIGMGSLACPLGTLALRLPFHQAASVNTTPLLAWSSVENTTAYELELSTSSSFATLVDGYPQDVDGISYIPAPLAHGTYYWRVSAKTPHNGVPTTARSFTVLPPPTPLNVSATKGNIGSIGISWGDVAGEDGYTIETSSNNTSWTLADTLPADSTSYTIPGLLCSTKLYVRVRSFFSTPYRQSLPADDWGQAAACEITNYTPSDNAIFSDSVPTFTWDPIHTATSYEITIATSDTFSVFTRVSGYPKTITGTSYTDDKLANGTYYWRLRQLLPTASSYTVTRTFTNTHKPNPITPIGQFNASSNLVDRVRLSWEDVSGEGGYAVEESPDNLTWTRVGTVPANITTYHAVTAIRCAPSNYYRIRAISIVNPDLAFAPTAAKRGALVCGPTLSIPANNATVTENVFQFHWYHVPNTVNYEIDISTSPTFETSLPGYPKVAEPNPNYSGSTFEYVPDALPNGVFYWRVRTKTPVESGYSAPFKLTISTAYDFIPDIPVGLLPMNVLTVRTTRPTYSWTPAPYATLYEMVVSDTPNFKRIIARGYAYDAKTSYTPLVTLQSEYNQGVHYWRVRSIYEDYYSGDRAYSEWSTPLQYVLNPALTPTDNGVVTTASPTATTATVVFTWAAAPYEFTTLQPPMYTVQLDTEPTFALPYTTCVSNVMTVKTCSIPDVPLGTYYWRIIRDGEELLGVPVSNRFIVGVKAPAAPVLKTPVNNKLLQPDERPAVELKWDWGMLPTPVGDFTYDVEISTSKTFNIEATHLQTGLTAPTYITPALSRGTYYWRVRAVTIQGIPGPWNSGFSFVIDDEDPAAPTIKTPAANVIVSTVRPAFTWGVSTGAKGYEVEINDVCDDGSPLRPRASVLTTTYAVPAAQALSQGEQVFCVSAYDAAGNKSPFSSLPFTVFLGSTPAANAFIPVTSKPTFTWVHNLGTTGYTLYVDDDTDLTNGDIYHISLGAVATHAISLGTLAEGTYYWRVVRTGETFTSNVYRRFYVGALNAGPILNPQTVINNPITLSWTPAAAPDGVTIDEYQVEFSKAATFLPLLSSTKISTLNPLEIGFTPQVGQNAIRHYWRVRGLVNGAPVTAWTTSSFIVDNVIPGMPVVTSPLANAMLNTVQPAITWTAVAGATRYMIAIEDSVTHLDVVPEQPVVGLKFVLPDNLPQTELVLRIRAEDTINLGDWRYVNFKVRLGTAPAQNGVVITNHPAFSWLAVPLANSYTLQIDNDPLFDGTVDDFPTKTITLGKVLTYTLTPEVLPTKGLYYWRLMADNLPYPAKDGSRTFYYTAPTATKPMGLGSFANGTTPKTLFNKSLYEAGGVTLSWTGIVPAPALYEIQVSTTALFPTVGTTQHTSETPSLLLTGNQLQDGVKHWRVRAVYSADRTSFGVWSDVKSFTLDQVIPLPPMIPGNGESLTATNRPTFTWANSLGAVNYYLTVEGTSIDHLLVTTTSYKVPLTAAPLNQDTENGYTWYVEAEDLAGNRSAASLDNIMYVFVSLTPKWAQFITDQTPVFTWTPLTGTGATPWVLEIATDEAMASKIYTSPSIAAGVGTFTLPNGNALAYGHYYWRVVRGGETLTNISGQSFYITHNIVNTGAKPEYPVNGAVIGKDEIEDGVYFQWKSVAPDWSALKFSEGYLLEISTTSTFATIVDAGLVLGDSSMPSNAIFWDDLPILDGKLYYWRVRGFYGALLGPNPDIGDFYALDLGPVGGVYTFKVDLTPPNTPVLGLPVANAVLTTRTPTFTWTVAAGAPTRYRVEISTTSGFGSVLHASTVAVPAVTLTLPIHQSLANGTYYWRVVAIDAAGNNSIVGSGRRFIISVP